MNISYKLNIVVVILIFLYSCALHANNIPKESFIVVIDPGHGGKDPGAVFKNIREKDVVLSIGLKLGSYIKQNIPDANIIFTRQSDVFVPLHERAEIANKNKADLFISLHANYCGTPSITGTETFVLGLHRSEENLEVAKKENAVILLEDDYNNRYEGFDPNSPESYIMFEIVQDDYIEQSINLASSIQDQFKNRAGRKDRSVKQAGFLVLRRTSMPSVLVEAGFLSNATEAKYMDSENGQAILASAIYRAVKDYKLGIDAKSDYKITNTISNETVEEVASPAPKPKQPVQESKRIHFSIQVAASSTLIDLNPANFGGLSPLFIQSTGKTHKYLFGKEYTLEKIQALKAKAQKIYPDAFIVAFENGEQIALKKAIKKLE
ncbi:N-acetylmuramoyl-L-alanine amidase family protein [Sunxiuqinia sp. A32]|uniref:N-acetylmuramoyl-L-alanine amidase family protein n=1 Tax=Sunxiuqinia sp. A32 TaxID=3461496 RepID=UPI004046850A